MKVNLFPVAKDLGMKRGPTTNSPRVLLLFSALMVMIIGQGNTFVSVLALLAAASAAGVALLNPISACEQDWFRTAERILVVSMVGAGLILTAGRLATAFAPLASPVFVVLMASYAIFGMTAVFSLTRVLPHMRWAFELFLLTHAGMAVMLLRSSPANIDVEVYLHDGVVALFHGHNPYGITVRNIYPMRLTDLLYGPGVVVDGRVNAGFPYPPFVLLAAIPGLLLGDVRYSQLIAMLVTALILRRLASDRIGRAVAVLGVASLSAIPVLMGAWTEPVTVALLACLVLALERQRDALISLFLGLMLVSKQYFVVVLPAVWLIRQWLTRHVLLLGLAVAAAVTLPLFLVDPATFWKAIVGIQRAPLRPDSISLLVSSVNTFGWPPPWTYAKLAPVGGGLTALLLAMHAPRTPAAFAASAGLTLLVTTLLSKQAFLNYYFLVSGAFLIAAVAWPRQSVVGVTTASRPMPGPTQ